MPSRLALVMSAFALAFSVGTTAYAHPRVVSSTPSANARVAAPRQLIVRFSERLLPPLARADLFKIGMGTPGTGHRSQKMQTGVGVDASGKALVVLVRQHLPAGRYQLNWRVVSIDTHRVQGNLLFTVR